MLSTRTSVGSIGILANHAPLMAMLEPTELRLYRSESDIVRFAQGEGYLQVVDNSALVLVEEAHRAGATSTSPTLQDRLSRRGEGPARVRVRLGGRAGRPARQAPLGGVPADRRGAARAH